MLAGIGGFSVSTAACIKNCANNALGIRLQASTAPGYSGVTCHLPTGCDVRAV